MSVTGACVSAWCVSGELAMEENVTRIPTEFGGDMQNETIPFLSQSGPVLPFVVAIKIVIGVTGLVGNLLVVVVVYKYTKLFQQVNAVYIINQSFIDAVVSALLIAVCLHRQYPSYQQKGFKNELLCKLWHSQILLWGLMTSSTYNLMAISIDRYMAIVHPMWHKVSFTKAKANASVVVIWMLGVAFTGSFVIPTTGLMNGRCIVSHFWPSKEIAIFVGVLQVIVTMILPIIVHCNCYIRILITLRKRVTQVVPANLPDDEMDTRDTFEETVISSTQQSTDNLPSISGGRRISQGKFVRARIRRFAMVPHDSLISLNQKAKRNVIKILAIVTICYFICWVPNKIYISMFMMGKISSFGHFFQATVIMVFINCCINPIIYIAKYDAFKKGLAMLCRCPWNSQ